MIADLTCDEIEEVCYAEIGVGVIQAIAAIIGIFGLSRLNGCCLCLPILWGLLGIAASTYIYFKKKDIILEIAIPASVIILMILGINFELVCASPFAYLFAWSLLF